MKMPIYHICTRKCLETPPYEQPLLAIQSKFTSELDEVYKFTTLRRLPFFFKRIKEDNLFYLAKIK